MDVGTIIFIVVLVIVMPVGILMSMAGLAGVIGSLIGRNSDLDNVTDDGDPNDDRHNYYDCNNHSDF